MGLNSALAIAGRSLEVFTTGIEVAGNNISNANTPGYIRERLYLSPSQGTKKGALVVGGGVLVDGIRQEIDKYLETRIHTSSSDFYGSQQREDIYKQLEATVNELSDGDLSTGLNEFLGKIQDFANQPEVSAVAQIAVQQGVEFAREIADMRARFNDQRSSLGVKVTDLVNEANVLIDRIGELNRKITETEAGGLLNSDAGGLRTERYNAMNRLAEIIPIRAVERETGYFDIFVGPDHLVLQGEVQHLETEVSVDREAQVLNVKVEGSISDLPGTSGELNGVIDGRDQILGGFIDELDTYTQNIIFEFNKIHASGQGTEGFDSVAGTYSVEDTAASLDAAGLAFAPEHGSFEVIVENKLTGARETTTIQIDLDGINPGPNTSLDSLRTDLDAISNVTATLTPDRRLELEADSNYEIYFANDDSGTLAALGINTFFTGSSSSDIAVNQAVLEDTSKFAVAQGGGSGDGSNALKLAKFIENPVEALGQLNLDDYYDGMISELAQNSASETAVRQGFESFRNSLVTQKQQFSGVSLDEEAIKVMELQRSYQMAARLIGVIDELLSTLVSL
ncbi:flagellar hook-associated protein FlgK [Symmachiella macrocystis]|uniref:Flagellar hook-associated protein 1 n=1 Tax=Symmachiella macrocystis TaxID=2527985 RepID=A0A5C6BJ93_9PLAN|nr:flagellar hook-associated protein FlgK [Symmachiella macrocystis]TWU11601.1 flagellar hook-associated protein FlgK [Symmachiella macrocystis]